VNSNNSLSEMPVVGLKTAAILREFVDHPEPPLADDEWIEKQIMALATKPTRRMASAEAAFNLELWLTVLRDYPRADLGYAVGRLLRESKWFPDVSEIVKLAEFCARKRDYNRSQAWRILFKHEKEWTPPIPEEDLCRPEDVAAILAEVSAEFSGKNGESDER
jgi:hypothetical protein